MCILQHFKFLSIVKIYTYFVELSKKMFKLTKGMYVHKTNYIKCGHFH